VHQSIEGMSVLAFGLEGSATKIRGYDIAKGIVLDKVYESRFLMQDFAGTVWQGDKLIISGGLDGKTGGARTDIIKFKCKRESGKVVIKGEFL